MLKRYFVAIAFLIVLSSKGYNAHDLALVKNRESNVYTPGITNKGIGWANGEYADLIRANLEGAHLQGANLTDADLRDAKFYGANLQGTNLFGANLRGATMPDGSLHD